MILPRIVFFSAALALWAISPVFAAGLSASVDINKQLSYAINNNQRDVITALVAQGANITDQIPIQWYPKLEMTEYLLELGASPNATDAHGTNGLGILGNARRRVPASSILPIAKLLVDHGADINLADKAGNTPLFFAIQGGSIDMLKFLVAHGADVNATNKAGDTPLALAIHDGNAVIAEFLLDHGAEINPKNAPASRSPLGIAIASRQPSFIALMLKYGANINGSGKPDITPLGKAAAITDTHDIAFLLLDHGADVNAANKMGETALHWAAQSGGEELVHRLLDAGANKRAKDRSNQLPVQWANVSRIRKLLNPVPPTDSSVLEKACGTVVSHANRATLSTITLPRDNDEDVQEFVELELPNDYDLYVDNWSRVLISGRTYVLGRTGGWPTLLSNDSTEGVYEPVCFFGRRGDAIYVRREIEMVLSSAKAMKMDPYAFAISQRKGTDALEVLLKASREKKYAFLRGKDYMTAALYRGVHSDRLDVVRLLLDHGADPNAVLPSLTYLNGELSNPPPLWVFMNKLNVTPDEDKRKHPVIYYAIQSSVFETVRLLLEYGADPNFAWPNPQDHPSGRANLWSRAPLARLVDLLLKHGGNPTYITRSSLEYLLGKNDNSTIKQLVAYGASPDSRDITEAGLLEDTEAIATLRSADSASHESSCRTMLEPLTKECLPSALVTADIELNSISKTPMDLSNDATGVRFRTDQAAWIKQRNRQCGLSLEPSRIGGWQSYVLADDTRAECVISMTRQRIIDLTSNSERKGP